ncbi:amidohydrolase family protein [Phaeobacter sp. C3_T13_0]|uniref:amidohydrolase family protein n=1 Tax=Phaeobacter cretensis TaxID=3342641 RepID=UPI0039BCAE59
MKIDAHQHFWALARGDYGWLTPELPPLYRDFLPADLAPVLRVNGVEGTVLVQAAPTIAETEFMLGLADDNPFILGVVGWVDFEAPDAIGQITRLATHPKFVGLRPMIQDISDVDWMLSKTHTPIFRAMATSELAFDALVLPKHLPNLQELVRDHPDLSIVIDHAAKPEIAAGQFNEWAANMVSLAQNTSVAVKLSGLVTEAAKDWTVSQLRPYVEHLLDHFGPTRMIWGSDWPVCTLACAYDDWCAATDQILKDLNETDRDAILGGNAARIYRIKGAA